MKARSFSVLVCALAVALVAASAHGATWWVDSVNGNNSNPGTSEVLAFRTIGFALLNTGAGDTIRVLPGDYAGCFDATGSTGDKPLEIIADDPDNAVPTVIDGAAGGCGPGGSPAAVVTIGSSDSRLEGFTITGGGASGVRAFGQVAITNNIIEDNIAERGGGLFFFTDNCTYGDNALDLSDNTIRNNTALALGNASPDGGGVFIEARALLGQTACLDGNTTVTIDNNTIEDNKAGSDGFGGGLYIRTNSRQSGSQVDVAVTRNMIRGNELDGNSASSGLNYTWAGGGAWLSTFGYGTESISVTDNTFENNVSTFDGGGLSAWIQAFEDGNHELIVQNNTVSNNHADGNGGGMDLFMFTDSLFPAQSMAMRTLDNTITGNTARTVFCQDDFAPAGCPILFPAGQSDPGTGSLGSGGGGGILASLFSERTLESSQSLFAFEVAGNVITGNTAEVDGAGMGILVSADGDPPPPVGFPPDPAPTSATIDMQNNLIAQNTALAPNGASFPAVGGGVFAFLQSFGEGASNLNIVLNTIAANTTETGSGGLELEQLAFFDTTDNDIEGQNTVRINSSLLTTNDSFAIGGPSEGVPGVITPGASAPGDPPNLFNLHLDITFSDLFGNGFDGVEAALEADLASITSDFITEDPLLDGNFVPLDPCSPAIDSADPGLPFADEPGPNGDRANMGDTGGTTLAARSLADVNGDRAADGIDVVKLSTAHGSFNFNERYCVPLFVCTQPADFDQDNDVDGDDLTLLGVDFGKVCP
ncbi:MAG: hypothetical protein GY716_02505 [bacterium]|nr:hypothetical protein [bacterium]